MRFFLNLFIVLTLAACSNSKNTGAVSSSSNATVAEVNGSKISDQELTEAAKRDLQKIETEIYQIKRSTLNGLIEERLLGQAADKAGLSVDKYMEQEISSKAVEPTEEEIKALYEARKGKNPQPYEQLKPQIASYLKRTRQAQAEQELLDKLRADAKINVNLEPPRAQIATEGHPSMGPKDAPVTLVEISDYQCPFCKRVQPTLTQIMNDYNGKVRRVFIDFPLSFHADAQKAHEAALCAGEQDKYFDMYHKLFESQPAIKVPDLKKYAGEIKLDTSKFNECLDSGKFAGKVKENIQIGSQAGVSGTPAFFVNGIMLSGAQPYTAFKEIIDSELAMKK